MTTHQENKTTTHVIAILDMSGSMMGLEKATIDGYNEYINGLKSDGNPYKVSLTLFDTVNEHPYTAEPIGEVIALTDKQYKPRGRTALYDAVCATLNEVKSKVGKDEKAVCIVITDGGENSSHEYTQKQFIALKKSLEKQGNWTFVYLGANQDAWDTARQWGYRTQNVATYNATTRGTGSTYAAMQVSTSSFAAQDAQMTADFIPQEVQQKLKETK